MIHINNNLTNIERKLPDLKSFPSTETTNDSKLAEIRPQPNKRKKRIKRVKSSNINASFVPELQGIDDDIVDMYNISNGSREIQPYKNQTIGSLETSSIFVEKHSCFKEQNKIKLEKEKIERMNKFISMKIMDYNDSYHFALETQKVFKHISFFVHGLLGGIAIWHLIKSYTDLSLDTSKNLALLIQCIFHFLFTFCIVSSLDMIDPIKYGKNFLTEIVRIQLGTLCIIIYLIGFMSSLACSYFDQEINLYRNETISGNLTNYYQPSESLLNPYKVLNTIRCICATLGWILICFRPYQDQLIINLVNLKKQSLDINEIVKH